MRTFLLIAAAVLVVLTPAAEGARSTGGGQPRVTLRVKDAQVRDVIQSLRKQCGIRNVVVDDDVSGRASFYFSDVPCSTAWPVVLKTYGLTATAYSETVMHVETRR